MSHNATITMEYFPDTFTVPGVMNNFNYQPLPHRSAWICPRCNKVNAPHVDQCQCNGFTFNFSPEPMTPLTIDFKWVYHKYCRSCAAVVETEMDDKSGVCICTICRKPV